MTNPSPNEIRKLCDALGGMRAAARAIHKSDRTIRYWCSDREDNPKPATWDDYRALLEAAQWAGVVP